MSIRTHRLLPVFAHFFCCRGESFLIVFGKISDKAKQLYSSIPPPFYQSKEVIKIILDYEKAEEEYISSNLSYAALASKYNIPLRLLARYAKDNNWVNKRKRCHSSPDSSLIDVSRLARSSDTLETIIENAFSDLSHQSADKKEVDTKTLKDLTSTLKEAINIKQNIFLLPMLTEQKQLELDKVRNPSDPSAENEIKISLEDDADKYCV